MPKYARAASTKGSQDNELGDTYKILDTVQRQIASYRASLQKVRNLKSECEDDGKLNKLVRTSPEAMAKVLTDRGVPVFIAVGMAAEDFNAPNFGGELGFWTWDCCCTGCCVTSCIGTNITNFADELRDPVPVEVLIGGLGALGKPPTERGGR